MVNYTATTLVLLLSCTALMTAQARLFQDDAFTARSLQQVNQRCPAGCDAGGCVLDSTSGGYKCTKCKGQLVVNADNGQCECPAGRKAGTDTCADCDKGSFCLGGTYTGAGVPAQTACPNTLTTIGKRSTSKKACVNVPGYSFTVDASGEPGQNECPVNTYGPGLRKQRACVPCPPGYITEDTKNSRASACVVPAGYYLKGPGQVAPCPKGEYKAGNGAVASCSKCAAGVSTPGEASTSESACTEVLPTFYPASIVGGIVKSTEKCPQKFYCPGGSPSEAFSTTTLEAKPANTVNQCAYGTWTESIGASSADQCMTPPGYKTDITAATTTLCDDGNYRAEWKPAAQAGTCDACGAGISSEATEQITSYAPTPDATASPVPVRGSAAACYIKPGQGMYFSPATNKYTAVSCDSNNYGVANTTYGLAAYPCRDCPAGMQTMSSAPSSDYKATLGYTSPLACVTKAGFGYNGRMATQCPVGSYNAAGNYGTCTQCPAGYSTTSTAAEQVSSDDCKVAAGYGLYNGAAIPCPVGTFNPALMSSPGQCSSCGTGLTTSQAGGDSADDCNLCQVGYGDGSGPTACATQCGGASATYGPAGRASSSPDNACEVCPAMSVGFSFDYLAQNQAFTPDTVARTGAGSAADCVAEFAQIEDAAWMMGGSVALSNITDSASTWDACVAACKASDTCQYITYDYDRNQCFVKTVGTASTTGDVLAFKAVVAGDTSAASTDAKALASGSYTFWAETAAGVGTSSSVGPITSGSACLSACDSDAACAAVAMSGVKPSLADAISSCSLIKGDNTVAQFKRSVTKTVVTKLQVSAAL